MSFIMQRSKHFKGNNENNIAAVRSWQAALMDVASLTMRTKHVLLITVALVTIATTICYWHF